MPRSDSQPHEFIPSFSEETMATFERLPKKSHAIKIPLVVLADDILTLAEKILFGFVLLTDISEDGSYWTNGSIEKITGFTQPTITKSFKTLQDRGLVEITYDMNDKNRTKRIVKSRFNWALVDNETVKKIYSIKNLYPKNKPLANRPIVFNKLNTDIESNNSEKILTAKNSEQTVDQNSHQLNTPAIKHSTGHAARQRAAARPKKADPAIQRIVDRWCQIYADEHNGQRYPINRNKDYPAVKTALKTISDGDAEKCCRWFMTAKCVEWERDKQGVMLSVALHQRVIVKWQKETGGPRKAGTGFGNAKVKTHGVE